MYLFYDIFFKNLESYTSVVPLYPPLIRPDIVVYQSVVFFDYRYEILLDIFVSK